MRRRIKTGLSFVAAVAFLFAVALGIRAFMDFTHVGRTHLSPPSPEEIRAVAEKRNEAYFNKWYAEQHARLLYVVSAEQVSVEEYRERLRMQRQRYPLAMALPADTTSEGFPQWQLSARQKLHDLLYGGTNPQVVPLEVVEEPLGEGLEWFNHASIRHYRLRQVRFRSRSDRTLRALVSVPRDIPAGARLPGIVALGGHHSRPEGCFAVDLFSTPLKDPGGHMSSYAHILANAGYVVIAPDTAYCPYIGNQDNYQAPPEDWTHDGARVWDAIRAVDVLVGLPEVDSKRIGAFGHSLGGETAMLLGALDDRIKVTVMSGYLQQYDPTSDCRCHIVPGFENFLRYADVCALIAPRFLMDTEGIKDIGKAAEDTGVDVRFAFQVAGAAGRFVQLITDRGHNYYAGPEVLDFIAGALAEEQQ